MASIEVGNWSSFDGSILGSLSENFLVNNLAFCYWEGRGTPENDKKALAPLKILKTIERTIETIAYCLKNNALLSFAPLNFFLAESQQLWYVLYDLF